MGNPRECQCMCGAVSFAATPKQMTMDACHCEMCRKWAGGVFLSVECSDINITDESDVTVFKSSDWAERLSCAKCGTTLVWRMQDGSFQSVALPAFADAGAFVFDRELFIDNKPANYSFSNTTRQLTEAQLFAALAPSGETN